MGVARAAFSEVAHHGGLAAAADALKRFVREREDITIVSMGDGRRFMKPSLLSRYLRGLKLVGLKKSPPQAGLRYW